MNPRGNSPTHLPDPTFFAQLIQNYVVLLVASVGVLSIRHNIAGAGSLLIGALISAANFRLLSHSIPRLVRADLAAAPTSRTSRIVRRALFEFLGRYVMVGGVAYLAIRNHSIHLMAFAMGLSWPIFAIMIQGVRLTFSIPRAKSA